MIGGLPKRPTGQTSEASFDIWVWETLMRLRFNGPGVSTTTKGISIAQPRAAGGSTTPVTVKQYRFKSMQGDHIVCRTWNGTSEGTTDVNIAKPFKLRFSITGVVIDGSTINYSAYNATNQTRVAAGSSPLASEIQVIVPRYTLNDIVYGITVDHSSVLLGGGEVLILDINACGRAWSRKYV